MAGLILSWALEVEQSSKDNLILAGCDINSVFIKIFQAIEFNK